jgi:hypothetical protein
MFLHSMQAAAKKLIDKYGTDITLIEHIRGEYNPDTGEYDTMTVNYPTKAHIGQFDSSLVVAGVVNADDLKLTCYNDGVLPDKDWTVSLQGRELTVISVQNITTAQNGFITFDLQVRG